MAGSDRIFIVFDTETTGLAKASESSLREPQSITTRGDEVCQIGGIILNNSMTPVKFFCHYCDTVVAESSQSARSVHKIDMRQVRTYLSGQFLPEVMERYLPEFFYPNVVFIGYNIGFDMRLTRQTLSNSPFEFNWKPIQNNIIPKRGRYTVDVPTYLSKGDFHRKLSSYSEELRPLRAEFLSTWETKLEVDTNCLQLLKPTWNQAHNSFFDSLNTYLLWSSKIWKKKLI